MRIVIVLVSVGLLFMSTGVSAQLRVTPVFGYYHPTKTLGSVVIPEGSGTPGGAFAVSRTSAPLIGLRISNSFGDSRFGWEAAVLRLWNDFDWMPTTNRIDYERNTVARNETPLSLRFVANLSGEEAPARLRVFAGPAMVLTGQDWLRPDDAEWAAVAGAGVALRLSSRLDLTGDVENYSYTTLGSRWQHDLAFSLGMRLRSR